MLGQGGRRQRRRSDAGVRGSGAGSAHRARHAGLVACAVTTLALAAPRDLLGGGHDLPAGGDARTPTRGRQISILGTAASNIESVTATGSISGSHLGTLTSYLSSPGASFVPQLPFTEGEEVHVGGAPQRRLPAGRLVHDRAPGAARRTAAPDHGKAGRPGTLRHRTGTETAEGHGHHGRPEPRRRHLHGPDPAPEIHPGKKLLEFEPVGPDGLMILNPEGKMLWWHQFKEEVGSVSNPSTYEGKTAISWWQGKVTEAAYGLGEGVIANTSYEPIAHVKAGNGLQVDIHELYITPEGQAWIIAVRARVPAGMQRRTRPRVRRRDPGDRHQNRPGDVELARDGPRPYRQHRSRTRQRGVRPVPHELDPGAPRTQGPALDARHLGRVRGRTEHRQNAVGNQPQSQHLQTRQGRALPLPARRTSGRQAPRNADACSTTKPGRPSTAPRKAWS